MTTKRIQRRGSYLQLADFERLEEWCKLVRILFDDETPYLVGSVNARATFRDVDLRVVLDDETFDRLFKKPDKVRMLNRAVSAWGQRDTGLPIDFQVQRRTEANAAFTGFRNPMGGRDWGTCPAPAGTPWNR